MGPFFAKFHTFKMLPYGLWESQLVHCSLLKHPYGRPWICFFGMEVTSRGPFLRDALIMSRSPSYNVAVSGRSKTLLRCGTRSLQRFGRFGISAGGYSPQTKGVIEFGGWSRESQALFSVFLISQKKNDASKNSTIFVEKSTTLFKTLPTLFLVAPSNNLPLALIIYRIECSSSSCQHITPASFGGVRSHRRDENA